MTGGGFQTSVSTQPAPAVAGDFASANPRTSFDAGPGGLVAGASGLTIGVFAWVSQYPADPNGTGQQASNTGQGLPSGFVHREQQGLITAYLDNAEMSMPAGFACTLMTGGDFWAKNDGTNIVLPGQKAYASLATGKVRFGATGSATQGATSNLSSLAAATGTCTATIVGNIMTVTGTTAGTTLVVGATLSGNAGSAGGDAVATGTKIIRQLSGSTGGIGTYALNIGEQNVTSTTVTATWAVLTVGGTITGTFVVGEKLTGTGVAASSFITALGTGTGGAGTYIVDPTQAMSNSTVQVESDIETKFVATSGGRAGELVKMAGALSATL
jgi:hypothetical protein